MITDFNHTKKEQIFFDFQKIIDDKLISKKEIEILQKTYLNKLQPDYQDKIKQIV